jgi:hypothetical protein
MSTLPPENRFAEITRKARAACALLNAKQRASEANERPIPHHRDYVTAEPGEAHGPSDTSTTSAVDRASATFDGHEKPKP